MRVEDALGEDDPVDVRASRWSSTPAAPGCDQRCSSSLEAAPDRPIPAGLRTTKGIHVTCPPTVTRALAVPSAVDGRLVFVIPWLGHSWIGTTDTDFDGDPSRRRATGEDVRYMMASVSRFVPALAQAPIHFTNAGVRALVRQEGDESSVSRSHRLLDGGREGRPGLVSIVGGKLTGYRAIAEEVTDLVCEKLGSHVRSTTAERPLPGAGAVAELTQVPREHVADAVRRARGASGGACERGARRWPRALSDAYPDVAAQVVLAAREEQCVRLTDFLLRRTRLGFTADQGRQAVAPAAALLARELGWSERASGQRARPPTDGVRAEHAAVPRRIAAPARSARRGGKVRTGHVDDDRNGSGEGSGGRAHRRRGGAGALHGGADAAARAAGRQRPRAEAPRARRHLHHRPQRQLHQPLRRALQLLRVLPAGRARATATCSRSTRSSARSTRRLRSAACSCCLQGGHNPDLPLAWYEDLFRAVKARYPGFKLHALSPSEVLHISRLSKLSTREVIARLIDAGLDSIPGGGAEILVDRVRKLLNCYGKSTSDEWLRIMEEAHEAGLRTTATMMYGSVETVEERIEHLVRLREVQDRTGGFTAFIAWSYQPEHTELGLYEATGVDYLRTLALARIVLDNFDNLQASWVTQGGKVGQLSLAFGANDMGSVMIEENVVRAAGASYCMDEIEIVRNVENAGFAAKRRNMHYEILGDPIFRERAIPRRLSLDVAKGDGDQLMPDELSNYEARTRAGRERRRSPSGTATEH